MEITGLLRKIYDAGLAIDSGRKGFGTRGKEQEGRLSYEWGITEALSTFRDAQSTIDPHVIILVEYTFLNQELQFCGKTDKDTRNSLIRAIQSFDDAFLAIEVVENSILYKGTDKTIPHYKDYRIKQIYPKDAFHIACVGHQGRLRNILRTPGVDEMEKALQKQRYANLATAQRGYIEKQKKALANEQ